MCVREHRVWSVKFPLLWNISLTGLVITVIVITPAVITLHLQEICKTACYFVHLLMQLQQCKERFITVYADGVAFLFASCCSQVIKSVAGAAGVQFLLQAVCVAWFPTLMIKYNQDTFRQKQFPVNLLAIITSCMISSCPIFYYDAFLVEISWQRGLMHGCKLAFFILQPFISYKQTVMHLYIYVVLVHFI